MNEFLIRQKSDEIVERANTVAEIVDSIKQKNLDPYGHRQDAIYHSLSEACAFEFPNKKSVFELSEHQYKYLIENTPMRAQLAGNPQGSLIGNQTYGSLNMFIAEVGSSMAKDFTLTPWFPDVPVETYQVQVDRRTRIAGLLPENDYGADLMTIRTPDTYAYQYEGVRWAGMFHIGPQDMIFIRQKGAEFYQRGIEQKIAYTGLMGMVQAFTTRNWYLSQAVMQNGFSYMGIEYASGLPSSNVYTFSQPLGTYQVSTGFVTPNANCNPIQEFANALAAWTQFLPYRGHLKQIVLNQRDYTAIVMNPNFQALFGNRTMVNEKKEFEGLQKEVFTFDVPQLGHVEFMVESEQWMDISAQGLGVPSTSQYFIPSGSAFMGLDLSEYGGRLGAFHLTPALENGGYANPQVGIGCQVYDMTNINPGKPEIQIVPFLNGGPAIYMPEAVFTINFNYTLI